MQHRTSFQVLYKMTYDIWYITFCDVLESHLIILIPTGTGHYGSSATDTLPCEDIFGGSANARAWASALAGALNQ